MEHYFVNYENFPVVGDFNLGEENSILKDFMNSCNLENVVKKPTCFKSDCLKDSHHLMTSHHLSSFRRLFSCIVSYRLSW